jgi:hypothetical protein
VISGDPFFRQVRAISIVIISIFLALSWGYLANKDGLTTLARMAVVVTFVGIAVFFYTASMTKKIAKQPQSDLTVLLIAFLLYSSCISCGLTSAGVFLTVILANQSNAATGAALVQPVEYDVRITVKGLVQLVENQETPFSTTSGQVNFGCEDTRTVEAGFQLPLGATLAGQPIASWQNFDNAKDRMQPTVQVVGDRVIAQGVIRGLDYQNFAFVRNCPGGGHGELVITGRFRTAITRSDPKAMTISSALSTATQQPVWVTLPPATELNINEVDVEFRSKNTGKSEATLRVTLQTPHSAQGQYAVNLDEQKRLIGLIARA